VIAKEMMLTRGSLAWVGEGRKEGGGGGEETEEEEEEEGGEMRIMREGREGRWRWEGGGSDG